MCLRTDGDVDDDYIRMHLVATEIFSRPVSPRAAVADPLPKRIDVAGSRGGPYRHIKSCAKRLIFPSFYFILFIIVFLLFFSTPVHAL